MTDSRLIFEGGDGARLAPAAGPLAFGSIKDWVALLKPRILLMVAYTGIVGMAAAPGRIDTWRALAAILAIAGAAGGCSLLNMWYDRDIDAVMSRTRARPIPAGRIAARSALKAGGALSIAAVVGMFLATNLVAAALLAAAIIQYVLVYTVWLKRRTPQNIVIGGAAGALPPLVGWAAVTGSTAATPLLLAAIIALWTPPHFWSLALRYCEDYRRARVPMLPVVSGALLTRREIGLYTNLLVPVSLLPWTFGESGALYGVAALLLGIGFLGFAWSVTNDRQDLAGNSLTGDRPARRAFGYSIFYLIALFAAFAIDQQLR